MLTEAQNLAHRLKGRLLTISSKEEDEFIATHDAGRSLWLSGWWRHDLKQWRDERNRPLRYLGPWSKGEPHDDPNQSRLHRWPARLGWSNQRRQDSFHACIEWGEEYPGEAVQKSDDEQPLDPTLSRLPLKVVGQWPIANNELVMDSEKAGWLTFGDPTWSEYDLKVEACCKKIGLSYNLLFHCSDTKHYWLMQIGNYGPKNFDLVAHAPGLNGWKDSSRRYRPDTMHGLSDVWQTIEIKARRENVTVLVDGDVIASSSHPELTHGGIGFHHFSNGVTHWRNLEVRQPDGTLLWKGFPTLPIDSSVDPPLQAKMDAMPSPYIEGNWRVEDDELITEPVGDNTWQILTFGDPNWTDYNLKVESCCNRPGLTYSIVSRFTDKANFWHLSLGAFGQRNVDLVGAVDGQGHGHVSRRFLENGVHGKPDMWQAIEIQTRGEKIDVIIDGKPLTSSSRDRLDKGCVGLHTFSGGLVRWRNLEVRSPDGTLLWKGFPNLSAK